MSQIFSQQEESFIQDILCSNWGGSVGQDLSDTDSNSSDDVLLICDTDTEESAPEDGISIDEMLISDYKTCSDLLILKYQSSIIGHLRKYIKNIIDNEQSNLSIFETKRFLDKIKFIHQTSAYLTEKNNMKKYVHKYDGEGDAPIPRSSYKFCNNGHECKFNYNTLRPKKSCFAHHYVYNMVLADTSALIIHLEKIPSVVNLEQIMVCMNTLTFVINHMYNEMHNWENCQKAIKLIDSTNSFQKSETRFQRPERIPKKKSKKQIVQEDGWTVVTGKKKKS